jgi:hypothetical protein
MTSSSQYLGYVHGFRPILFRIIGLCSGVANTSLQVILLIGAALISRIIAVGNRTREERRFFFLLQNTSVTLTTIATSWTKVAFALTLTRIARHKVQLCFLWFIIVTANLVLIPGIISTWVPACGDPRARFRPVNYMCYDLAILQYLGGATMSETLLSPSPCGSTWLT